MSIHEAALWSAYLDTSYVAFVDDTQLELRVGRRAPELDALLERVGATTWCFVTAWNPDSTPLDAATNEARSEVLRGELSASRIDFYEGEGRGRAGDWPPEASFLVVGLAKLEAVELAQRHGQRAVVCGERGGIAELVDCRTAPSRPTQ